jgi:GTP-binding protein
MRPGVIAIVGRPNVGKSCLFNRILGKRKAIVEKTPGVTRDRIYGQITWRNKKMTFIDTGGIDLERDGLKKQVLYQVKLALEEAEVILFVCDITSLVSGLDEEIANIVRSKDKKVILAVNKVEHKDSEYRLPEFFHLGLGRPHPVSALHGLGIGDILDEIARNISQTQPEDFSGLKIAIVGRPNVGKSSYLNALLKEERVVVNGEPGTTRDAVDTILVKGDKRILLIDTAGIRHKSRLREELEFYAVLRAQEAIWRADVCLLLIDAYQGLTVDDVRILNYLLERIKPIVLIVNKWDLISNLTEAQYRAKIKQRIRFAQSIPVSFCSSLKRENIIEPIEIAERISTESLKKVPTTRLNDFLQALVKKTPPPTVRGRRPKFLYITQIKAGPPTFKIFVSDPSRLKSGYVNFVKKQLRLKFALQAVAVELLFRARKEK